MMICIEGVGGTEEKKRGWHGRGANAEERKLETVKS